MLKQLGLEHLPRESAKAFAAFRAYCNLGPQRSLARVAADLGKSKVLMERWSRQHRWLERIAAHDRQVAELEREAIERLAVERAVEWHRLQEGVKREAWNEAQATLTMVRKAREDWLNKGRTPGWEGLARMLELAFKLKQFAAGMPSEVKEVNTTVSGTIDIEWEAALRKTFGPRDGGAAKVEVRSANSEVVDVQEVSEEGRARIEGGGLRMEEGKEP